MATPPSSRGSSLDHTFRPSTPEARPVFSRSTITVNEPKSEYLRHALQAARAMKTPTPASTPIEPVPPRLTTPVPSKLHTPAPSPDEFDEFDLPPELMEPESPIRRRRPNDDSPPRNKTAKELSAEVEKLRNDLIQQNIKVELLKRDNHEVHAKWVKAKQEVERLKLLQEENEDLAEENKKLHDKLDGLRDYEDQLEDLSADVQKLYDINQTAKTANENLKKEVLNLTKVNNEAIASMQDQQGALDEAVEMITNLEGEKTHLEGEFNDLKARVAAIESRQVDGSANYPHRICSIDESRPATSYDDSDYYSQPATPRADPERDCVSIRSGQTGTSTRSKRFIELSKERTKSAHNLSKRMSEASLRAANLVSAAPASPVSQVPEEPSQITPRAVEGHFRERSYRQAPGVEQHIATSASQLYRPATVAPVQTHQPSGLHKERWWKDTEHVRPLRSRATTRTLREDLHSDDVGSGSPSADRIDETQMSPTTPAAEQPQRDFLFNPKENEDQFMKKTISKLRGSIRRRYTETD
ncbi:hypothetical protein N0V94_007204 [Neodidymelliopsis sp. IMI 364377]|nr:hypothetical protein N0V94_007204 [Neodidymelliopsis sp. IMI 364377]